jgi:hypothetical protein
MQALTGQSMKKDKENYIIIHHRTDVKELSITQSANISPCSNCPISAVEFTITGLK